MKQHLRPQKHGGLIIMDANIVSERKIGAFKFAEAGRRPNAKLPAVSQSGCFDSAFLRDLIHLKSQHRVIDDEQMAFALSVDLAAHALAAMT